MAERWVVEIDSSDPVIKPPLVGPFDSRAEAWAWMETHLGPEFGIRSSVSNAAPLTDPGEWRR